MEALIIKILAFILLLLSLLAFPLTVFGADGKRIEVNLTKQQLYAYQHQTLTYNFPISSGTLLHQTVTGTFYLWEKYLSYEMVGGSKLTGDYYDLPNVPYVVYFYQGFALHGTYWHHNFGHPMSHGCINLPTYAAKLIYYWIDYSTPITIYGYTPSS